VVKLPRRREVVTSSQRLHTNLVPGSVRQTDFAFQMDQLC